MKYTVTRIEEVLKSGISKTGNAYALDFVNLTVAVSVNDVSIFGSKETTYKYGAASNFARLEVLRGRLPLEVDLDIGIEMDTYGNPQTVITDVKLPTANPMANK